MTKELLTIHPTLMITLLLLSFPISRIEHEAFTASNLEAYRQLVRVLLVDFLPFVKMAYDSLYSQEKVVELALAGSPYALRHKSATAAGHVSSSSSSSSGIRGDVVQGMRMELNVMEIAEPMRHVAPEVFQELEDAAERACLELDSNAVDVATATTRQEDAGLGGGGGGKTSPSDGRDQTGGVV